MFWYRITSKHSTYHNNWKFIIFAILSWWFFIFSELWYWDQSLKKKVIEIVYFNKHVLTLSGIFILWEMLEFRLTISISAERRKQKILLKMEQNCIINGKHVFQTVWKGRIENLGLWGCTSLHEYRYYLLY